MENRIVTLGVVSVLLLMLTVFSDEIAKAVLPNKKEMVQNKEVAKVVNLTDVNVQNVKAADDAEDKEELPSEPSPPVPQKKIVKWVDENGKTHFGDTTQSAQVDAKPVELSRVNAVNVAPVKGTPEQEAVIKKGRRERDREWAQVRANRTSQSASSSVAVGGGIVVSEGSGAAESRRDATSCEEYQESRDCLSKFRAELPDGRTHYPGADGVCPNLRKPEGC